VLRLLITIVGLVVGRSMMSYWGIGLGMVNWGMVNNWGMVYSMVGYNWCIMNSMMNRGSMMDRVSTKCCEWNGRTTSHKGDKSNQSKDLHDVAM